MHSPRVETFTLSVIIPAYNAIGTISKCLDSILSLPMEEGKLEVIVVDDCSTDGTPSILAQYEEEHQNVIVVRQEFNQRQGAARNRGIDLCNGEYVLFVDADDVIVPGGICKALKKVQESEADVCYFDFEFQTIDGNWHLLDLPEAVRNSIMDSRQYLEEYYTTYYNGPCRSLYKSSFLKRIGIRFVEGVQWEDCDWTVKVLSKAKKIQFVDGVGYRYGFNSNSTTRQRSIKALSNRVLAGKRLMEFGVDIQGSFPRLSEMVLWEGRNQYVIEALRLRNLTKYTCKGLSKLHNLIGKECRESLLRFRWPIWERFFLRSKWGSLLFLSIACPTASIGRFLFRIIRGV